MSLSRRERWCGARVGAVTGMGGHGVILVGLLWRFGAGRVQICCKGVSRRDRRRAEARNINVSLPALRRNPGLCNRFGQLALPRRRRGSPGGAPRAGRRPRRAPPDAETCTSHSKVQFQPSLSSAKCTSRRGRGRRRGRRGPRCRSRPGASPATRRERRFIFRASYQFGCFGARRLLRGSPPWSSDGRKGRRPLHASGGRPGPVEDRRPRVDPRALRIPRSAMRTPSAHALRPRSAGRLKIIRPGRPIGLTNGMRGQMVGGFCLNSETCREGGPLQQWIRTEGAPSWAASDSFQGEMSCRLGSGGYCW